MGLAATAHVATAQDNEKALQIQSWLV